VFDCAAARLRAATGQRQARDWARQAPPLDKPAFVPDPLRSRRAQLPGGERGDAFRQRPPASKFVGRLFVAGEDPCLRAGESPACSPPPPIANASCWPRS